MLHSIATTSHKKRSTALRVIAVGLAALWVSCSLATAAWSEPSARPFEIVPGSFHFSLSSDQAGAHADWTTSFDFAHEGEFGPTYGDLRDVVVEVPAGFDASDTAAPTCTQAQLLGNSSVGEKSLPECPIASQVGDLSLELMLPNSSVAYPFTVPVYNVQVNSFGTTAELGYKTALFTGLLHVVVRPGSLGLTGTTQDVQPVGEARKIVFTVWGVPAATEHDAMRGTVCGRFGERPATCRNQYGSPQKAGITAKPLLSNPTSCGLFKATLQADSWEEPHVGEEPYVGQSATDEEVGPIRGCERVPFEAELGVVPLTHSAESPTGLDVSLTIPQAWEEPFAISTANLRDTTVALPEGMTANPSLAAGLGACTPQEYAEETASSRGPNGGCPPESEIGTITIETPLLEEPIHGSVYIATPYDNVPEFGDREHPGGSLLALYVVAKDPLKGIVIKLPGKVEPNETTGQLVTTFKDAPQQPFSKFTLQFSPKVNAPLISPPACRAYTAQGVLTPWSATTLPEETPVKPLPVSSEPFEIETGVHGGPCPSGGIPPFHPQVIAGTVNNAGGSYSSFYLRLLREDGEQELIKFSTVMPPGLTGNLTGIPFCPDADIEAAKNVTGAEEEAKPSCPASSEIGHTLVGAGVGTVLAQNPGKVYLAGPYRGAPLSIVSITSAKVGPFDLGTVVIRFALNINPLTSQVEISGAQSDPIPHIIKGIVVHVRDIRVYIDRPNFMLNPTNCGQMQIVDTVTGSGSNYANPANQDTVSVPTRFEAADCASLRFAPIFKATTSGRTSRKRGASLHVALTYPKNALGKYANIAKVKVSLPKQLPARLETLKKACLVATFDANPAACPSLSRVGTAKAVTPILPVPLQGPAYFVSYGGLKFPELIVVLQGYGITIDLHGETFIDKKTGITTSTFRTVPDQPVESFELTLPQGRYSALAANGNFCRAGRTITIRKQVVRRVKGHRVHAVRKITRRTHSTLEMPTIFVAQNGLTIKRSTPIAVTGCPKSKRPRRHRHRKK